MAAAAVLDVIESSNAHQKWCRMTSDIYLGYIPNLVQIPLTVLIKTWWLPLF